MNKADLAKSYDQDSHRRVQSTSVDWKLSEREHFLTTLHSSDKKSLLEIGAGTGIDSLYFKDHGVEVTSVDLSAEMISYCKEKGHQAYVMDFYNLEFADHTFEAVYSLNCLLHVPKSDIGDVLQEIKRVMKPDALFFMGLYGGNNSEGIWENDWCEPKRFFASYSDQAIRAVAAVHFKEVSFHTIPLQEGQPHFQALILQK
ncbi:class I SAM-dependent methyltransferase [Paenibacillus sp. OV219]|uniref:class I SAM-dependent methyltransferase n=1 Tax=Paenibacillus sp. OV219 TaxID=1884377 RepID=UPI0008D1C888|nr:class I SAM-dependent methyltransferase [Paenibacillus sp. OV219]SEO95216.1 Methyltransferase domain-containing protein [Paenibacillus sp. OV219]